MMTDIHNLITDNIDVWTSAIKKRNATGRGSNKKIELTGVKKLRELILELAVRGKLVSQDVNDEPASVLLDKIAEEKAQLIADKKIKKQKTLPEVTDEEKPFDLPYGWKWLRLAESYYPISPSGKKLKGKEIEEVGEYPVVDQGQTFIAGYTNLKELLIHIPQPVIVFGDHTTNIKYIDFNFVAGADGTKILCPILLFPRYFYTYLLNYDLENRGYARHFKVLNDNLIAIPSLAEQHRIVAKVDELMALCDQLEQQTENSITAHQTLVEELLNALFLSPSQVNTETDVQELAQASVEQQLIAKDGGNEIVADATSLQNSFQENWQRIADHFDVLFTTEASIDQLKQTILQLAVMGKLVPQNPSDEPASKLLEKIAEEKAQLIADKKIKKQKPLPEITDEEKPFELPSGWEWSKCQDLCLKITDGEHATPKRTDSGYYLLSARNVTNEGIILHDVDFVPTEEFSRIRKRCDPNIGDILISCSGSVGRVALVDRDDAYSMVRSAAMIRPDKDNLYKEYLALMLRSPYLQVQMKNRSKQSAQANLFLGAISNLVAVIPPLAEQQRIVFKVDELMSLCDQLKTRLADAQITQLHLADAVVTNALETNTSRFKSNDY